MQLFLWVIHELTILELHVHVSILLSFVIGIIPQNLLDYCFYCWSIGSQLTAIWQIGKSLAIKTSFDCQSTVSKCCSYIVSIGCQAYEPYSYKHPEN